MKNSKEFIEHVLDLLEPLAEIHVSKLFSGVVLKVEGRILGVLIDDVLYFKVSDESLQKQYREVGSKQFSYTRKDKKNPIVIKEWWSVPESALDSSEEIVRLAEEVLECCD